MNDFVMSDDNFLSKEELRRLVDHLVEKHYLPDCEITCEDQLKGDGPTDRVVVRRHGHMMTINIYNFGSDEDDSVGCLITAPNADNDDFIEINGDGRSKEPSVFSSKLRFMSCMNMLFTRFKQSFLTSRVR